jgi:hypothetical protein
MARHFGDALPRSEDAKTEQQRKDFACRVSAATRFMRATSRVVL